MTGTTAGTLLGGRVAYRQTRDGYRTGIEPVLLAACVPAAPGQTVLEAGTGAGAGLLCLAARVAGLVGIGIEIDPATAAVARANFAANGFAGLSAVAADVTQAALPACDHAMANPPWHAPTSTASPVAGRRLAKQEAAGVEAWIAALAQPIRAGGSLTLIVPPALAGRSQSAATAAGLHGATRLVLLPKPGRAAKLMILQSWRAPKCAATTEIVLHEADGSYTAAIEAVLRHGAPLLRAG